MSHVTRVFFRWACSNIEADEEVRVVGDCDQLGNWTPKHGVALETKEVCQLSRAIPLPLGRVVNYKYVIVKRADGDVFRWEDREDNRTIVPTGLRHVIEDDGGVYRQALILQGMWGGDHQVLDDPCSPLAPEGREPVPWFAASKGRTRANSIYPKENVEEEVEVSEEDTVFVVFRKLPFRVERVKGTSNAKTDDFRVVVQDSERHYFTVVSLIQQVHQEEPERNDFTMKFVGDPGISIENKEEQMCIKKLLAPYGCIPVFVDKQMAEQYLEFCNIFLWPVMHNMKVFGKDDGVESESASIQNGSESQRLDEIRWRSYQAVNRIYAEAIEANSKPGDLIWVHNYYLLLVPRYLFLKNPEALIGFFLHCAFPSSEVMRCLPNREEIVQSMLSCKVVTFQIFEYARHFISCCAFLLSTTHSFQTGGVLQIEHESRSIVIRADHFVLPFSRVVARLDKVRDKIEKGAMSIRQRFGNKHLFASIDNNEPFSGLILKLRAFQKFMSDCPQYHHRVALLQHVLVDSQRGERDDLLQELHRMANEINASFSRSGEPPVVQIDEGSLSMDQRLSVLQAADVLLDTSINDGWNLQPFMFYCAHSKDKQGVAIVSEFVGCSCFLTGAKKINPWNTSSVVEQMHETVSMEVEERENRFSRDHSYISSQTLTAWIHQNLAELKRTKSTKSDQPETTDGLLSRGKSLAKGDHFRHLNIDAVQADYRKSRCRVIFLDNEGTLAPKAGGGLTPYGNPNLLRKDGNQLDPQVVECLRVLARDPLNSVVVISGRGPKFLDKTTLSEVEGLGLCAEYGFYYVNPLRLESAKKGAGGNEGSDRWKCIATCTNQDSDWKAIVFELMKMYAKRVQGSIIEYKGAAISWNYREVGAQMVAKEMALELIRFLDPEEPEGLMHGYPVTVSTGKGYVEVKRSDINKGIAVTRVLSEIQQQIGAIDFVLCIGDDRSDEDMFEAVSEWSKLKAAVEAKEFNASNASLAGTSTGGLVSSPKETSEFESSAAFSATVKMNKKASMTIEALEEADKARNQRFYTVTVGRKRSKAGYFVQNSNVVSELLQKLTAQTTKAHFSRFQSMPCLAGQIPDSDEED